MVFLKQDERKNAMTYAVSAVVLVLFALTLLIGIKKSNTQGNRELLGRYNVLRGIFAVEIIVGHVIRFESTPLYPLGKVMLISVAFFFFVSGWGMTLSYHSKKDYLNGFLRKKCGYLLMLAVVTYAFRWLMTYLILHINMINGSFLHDFFDKTNWYIWELIIFYVLFWGAYKYLKKGRIAAITVVTVIMIIAFFYGNMLQGYYSSALAFPLGIAFGEYYEKITGWLNSRKGVMATIALTALGGSSLLLDEKSLAGMVFLRNTMCVAALFILFYILSYFRFSNRVLEWLKEISTELYLFQFVWLNVYGALITDWKIKLPVVVVSTFVTAVAMYWILRPVKKIFAVHTGIKN